VSRTKKDPVLLGQMCARLRVVLDLTGLKDAELSQRLGYANATTLSGVRRGVVFPDAERLVALGGMVLMGGAYPNLHWILTGVGTPFLALRKRQGEDIATIEAMNRLVLSRLAERL
jgi:hypothetical protein